MSYSRVPAAVGGVLLLSMFGAIAPAAAAQPTLGPNLLQNGGFEEPVIVPTAANYGLMTFTTGDTFPGWQYITSTNGYVDLATAQAPGTWTTEAINPAEGNQFIGLPGFGITGPVVGDGGPSYSLYQQYATEIGKTYQVSYWVAGGPNVETLNGGLLSAAVVTATDLGGGGNSNVKYVPTSSAWVRYTDTYTATKTTGGIGLYATSENPGVAPLFDGISVQEVIPAVVDTPIASAPVVLVAVTVAGVALAGVLAVLGWRRRVAVAVR